MFIMDALVIMEGLLRELFLGFLDGLFSCAFVDVMFTPNLY